MLDAKKLAQITWDLYQTHGVPIEVSEGLLEEKNLEMDRGFLEELIFKHQKQSQTTSSGQFKSGLGGDTAKTRKLHTTTHLVHQALREILGVETKQIGSAITDAKARFDFTAENKLTQEQLDTLINKVQALIDKNLEMQKQQMSPDEAKKIGAIGLFGEKYGDVVSVYSLVDSEGRAYSREFCGGPHIQNTSEIGTFKVIKQKSVGKGAKRIEFDVE